ncbi:DUF3987 domain-containing protein [Streptomyces sp. NPDC101118]|uniref:DUF3987 domain-containing protein n=1 Tax=Streptomyces sp. NPDC101118 TaxID=3366109 RepID=UPI00380C649C
MHVPVSAAAGTPLAGALWLTQRHFAVFPADHPELTRCAGIGRGHDPETCTDRGKHPAEPFTRATVRTDEQVRRLFGQEVRNVGVYVGGCVRPDGAQLLVIDSDRSRALEDTAEAFGYQHTPTMRVHTAKGHHDYYWAPATARLGNGLGALKGRFDGDVRAGNAYVISVGSLHHTGVVYTLEDAERPPVDAPAWLLDALQARPPAPSLPPGAVVIPSDRHDAYTRRAVQAECDSITSAPEGDQNNTINTAAYSLGTLVGAGALTEDEARDHLLAAARAGNHPEGRALATIASGLRAGMAQPRHPWPPIARANTRNDFTGLVPPQSRPTNPRNRGDVHQVSAASSSGISGTRIEVPEWDEPVSLASPPVPEFPTSLLGGLGEFVTAAAASLQVPVDLVAFAALATISTATGGRRRIQVKADWQESTALYLAALADSSEKKTPALNTAAAPLRAVEDELIERARPEVEATAQEIRITTARMSKAEQNAANAVPDKRQEAEADAEAARVKLLELGDTPELPRLLVRDITLEALAKRMYEQGGRIGSLASEGGLFKVAAGLYGSNGKANTDLLLEAYTGGPYTIDRTGRPSARMPHTFLALGLIVQPGIISGLEKQNPEFRQSGLLGRFLYAKPVPTEEDTFDSPPIPQHIANDYDRRIRDLVQRVWACPDILTMELSAPARQAFAAFYDAFAKRRKPAGDLHDLADWAGKLRGQLIRIAACLTLYEDPGAREISHQRVLDVLALAPYFIAHARAVFDLMGKNREGAVKPLRDVVTWLRTRPSPTAPFSARDAWQALKGREWATEMDVMNDVLLQLEEYGWIALAPSPETVRRGRKPSPRFDVHPLIHADTRSPL